MILKKTLLFFLIIPSIISCTVIQPEENLDSKNYTNNPGHLSCPVSELEKFMTFGVYFSTLSNQDKQLQCKQLRFKYKVLEDWHAGWNLAYAINDYSACGSINESIDILENIYNNKFSDEQIKWLIKQQSILLQRVKKIQQQKKYLKGSIKLCKEHLATCQDEKNSMVLKLHELKSIETSINQRLEKK